MDPRVSQWLAALDNIEASQQLNVGDPMYWAHVLSAIGNASLASLPDSVLEGVEVELVKRRRAEQRLQRKVQKQIRDKLRA